MEVLAVHLKFPPSEIKAMSLRERHNWATAALRRTNRMLRTLDG